MTAMIHGVYQGDVVIEDDHGLGLIPQHALSRMRYDAVMRDAATACWGGRRWDRDVLILADNTVREFGLVELPTCAACSDAPGVAPMGDGRTFCLDCASGAAGSGYDDREDQP
jgi:hypothetical protein